MILQFFKLKSNLSVDEMASKAIERKPQFEAIPGLIQKYYVKGNEEGSYGGVYIWDSMESILKFRESDLAKSIPEAYQTIEAPSVEVFEVLFQLRD